ncbi:hypothetical protein AB0A63_31570 [Lentzea sp. NPDC042327]|uniref:hypothetical protein n=1 Tax=Lentzea sp. NPDC042327 TaxID=3154801 RepID=UPI0033D57B63
MSARLPDCPVCLRRGWNDGRGARATLNGGRVPEFGRQLGGLVNDGDGQLHLYRCGPGLGLWHITNLDGEQFQRLVAPERLELPDPPAPVPPRTLDGPWLAYLAQVEGALVFAIDAQGRGRALPPARELAEHYQAERRWALVLTATWANAGLLHKIGHLYVTGTPRASEVPAS